MQTIPKHPQVFTVGDATEDNFTDVEIELLIYKIRDWFISDACGRTYSDPLQAARERVEQCLLATTKSGKPWARSIPATFEGRIKVKTHFDMILGNHVSQEREKTAEQKRNKKHREAIAATKGPKAVAATQHLQRYQDQLETDVLKEYPELDTPVHRPNILRLVMFYAEQERIRLELPGTTGAVRKISIETLALLQKTIAETMKSLDIYPDQIRKRMDEKRKGSVGDLVALLGEDKDFKAREKRWSLTLALQLWWMTQHPNGRKTGPQIHDFELWHLTRTRPIHYTCRCGQSTTLIEGFTPEDLRDYLLENDVLLEKPILPQMTTEEDLDGLADYSNFEPTHDDDSTDGSIDAGGADSIDKVSESEETGGGE